jgi:prepilin-type N-terminal cleavage/methylation domain-containing protein
MYTLPHVSKKGFTLIEMMIVIGIIGILTSALYPQINQYLERAKIVKYQAFAKDTIQVVKNYTTEI